VSEAPTYYEQWGPLGRRMRRAGHLVRLVAKNSLGLRPSILVELRWRLGDEIMALPIYQALRARRPHSCIEVLCDYPELLDGNPFVDSVNPLDASPDLYYLLRGAPRDAWRLEHYAAEASVELPRTRPQLYFCDWSTPLAREVPQGEGPLVAIAPGASWQPKRWPADSWRALAADLERRGCRAFELGGPDERTGVACSFAGRTTVGEAARLLHAANLVIACDSGLMHLARAANTPCLALFGPTDPVLYIRDDADFHPLRNDRCCGGCWNGGRMDPPGECPLGEPECLATIGVERVADEAARILGLR
jgi:ADP-heptose:LPS heptosyltransferase